MVVEFSKRHGGALSVIRAVARRILCGRIPFVRPQAMAESAVSHTERYLGETCRIAAEIDHEAIERIAEGLRELRERGGRLFLLGVGGSAANCSHAVNDFRKLCGIEAYTPLDNVSELTARINDDGWDTVFAAWLESSRACERDAILVLSVGGGDAEH